MQLSMAAATSQTAVDDLSPGVMTVELVMRRRLAAATDSDDPLGASLVWKMLSLMVADMGPVVLIAPPSPDVTWNSRLDHMAMPHGHV